MVKKFEEITRADTQTPRYRRAVEFTSTILSIMCDFIPRDRDCLRVMEDRLMRLGWAENAQIISVRPEWDVLSKVQIEAAMLNAHPALIVPEAENPHAP